jgi:redox-sensing transcriptional repressor
VKDETAMATQSSALIDQSGRAVRAQIPDIVIGRLPIYLRTLEILANEGQTVASSQELGRRLGISSAQIRKDLSHFGEFGKQGTGYDVAYLRGELEKILQVDCVWSLVLVGAGYLGHALASYNGFEERGFRIVGVYDDDADKIGTRVGTGLEVEPMSAMPEKVRDTSCRIGVIAVPAGAAQQVADELIRAGIQSLLSYAPITLSVPEGVRVEYIDPVVHFQHMTFYLEKECAP